jgi:hypothetical protein
MSPMCRASSDVPPEHLQRLAAKKPAAMSIDRTVTIHREVCAGDIALAEEVLPQAA